MIIGEDVEDKLLKHCKGATFYESKVLPIICFQNQ